MCDKCVDGQKSRFEKLKFDKSMDFELSIEI
jgi:hypothetical protein